VQSIDVIYVLCIGCLDLFVYIDLINTDIRIILNPKINLKNIKILQKTVHISIGLGQPKEEQATPLT
jgi:hypothetical protein